MCHDLQYALNMKRMDFIRKNHLAWLCEMVVREFIPFRVFFGGVDGEQAVRSGNENMQGNLKPDADIRCRRILRHRQGRFGGGSGRGGRSPPHAFAAE